MCAYCGANDVKVHRIFGLTSIFIITLTQKLKALDQVSNKELKTRLHTRTAKEKTAKMGVKRFYECL